MRRLAGLLSILAGAGLAACARMPASPAGGCTECPEMVRLPAGSFWMGDESGNGNPDEIPVHEVRVPAFWIGRHEVTFDQWDACARDGGCSPDIWDQGWGRGPVPAINVTWGEAQAYVRWLSTKTRQRYRLPTEAEWEYAARAGTDTPFPWGVDMVEGMAVCYRDCGPEADFPFPAGSAQPNPFGLYDMHGNVWEWVQDCWNDSYIGAPADGSAWERGDCEKRVARGGAWINLSLDLRSSVRSHQPWDIRFHSLGFRVARDD